MEKIYHENGKLSLFTNLRVPSLMSSLKALLILVCLQFACASAMAQVKPSVSGRYVPATKKIVATYNNAESNAIIKLYKFGDHYMHGNNATVVASSGIPNAGSGSITFSADKLDPDAYVVTITSGGRTMGSSYFVVPKNKIISVSRNGSNVVVEYEKEQSKKGGYTVMRFASATTGRIFNEQAYDPTVLKGTVNIGCQGSQFKSDTYVISMVVDGVVYDQKKINLYYY